MLEVPWLPPIQTNVDAHKSPVSDLTNPGDTNPIRQPAGLPSVDQTRSVVHVPGGAPQNSDGNAQFANPAINGTVTVTVSRSVAPTSSASGEKWQAKNYEPHDQGTRSEEVSLGLPSNVFPAEYSPARPIRSIAPATPIAVTVDAGRGRPGTLPENVIIK